MSIFTNVQLFGGAIISQIPSRFADVSTIRQVPDNQEVYLDTDGFTSLTFDITERVSHLPTDRDALNYHVADITAEEDSREISFVDESVKSPHFSPSTPILSVVAKITPLPSPNPKPMTPIYITMYFTLIRLEAQATDIVITLNVPTITGSPETLDESVARDVVSKVVQSFEVKDWNLFNGE